uniref:Uncharacterized protein n=1 Tax=Anguilla anguilla TaxID=7936 RepID=A0A0E9QL98_ANGAN
MRRAAGHVQPSLSSSCSVPAVTPFLVALSQEHALKGLWGA